MGFHKRKKKRRKEAKQKLEEAERRRRIELRKKVNVLLLWFCAGFEFYVVNLLAFCSSFFW